MHRTFSCGRFRSLDVNLSRRSKPFRVFYSAAHLHNFSHSNHPRRENPSGSPQKHLVLYQSPNQHLAKHHRSCRYRLASLILATLTEGEHGTRLHWLEMRRYTNVSGRILLKYYLAVHGRGASHDSQKLISVKSCKRQTQIESTSIQELMRKESMHNHQNSFEIRCYICTDAGSGWIDARVT